MIIRPIRLYVAAWLVLCHLIAIAQEAPATEKTVTIWVNGACGMCEDRIQKAAMRVPGVLSAEWDIDTKYLTVKTDPAKFDELRLHRAIAAVGHDTEKEKAPDAVYAQLHACCHYDRSEQPPVSLPQRVRGQILEQIRKGEWAPLQAASVHWLGTNTGVTTNEEGRFEIDPHPTAKRLVVQYVGFQPDTVEVKDGYDLEIVLSNTLVMKEVEVVYRRKATEVSLFSPIQVQLISERELLKAACCNLSESFETTPSVDVGFTDAVTGVRQIQLLGLSGPNIQITRESMPDVRGLSALYGLTYTAGPWVEGIQLSLGAGSVVNGFEAIAGQINVELRKPENTDRLYLNLYAAEMGRYEGNLNLSRPVGKRWHTGLLLHAKSQQREVDHNHDGFLDNPLNKALVAINRWKYQDDKGRQMQFGFKGTLMNEESGYSGYHQDPETHFGHWWGAGVRTRRAEAWSKLGMVFPDKPHTSMGLQLSALHHEHRSYFGLRRYDAEQQSAYANFIFQSIIGNTNHQYRVGASVQWDHFDERITGGQFLRNETVPGIFAEYTYRNLERFTAVLGIRADHHNLFGAFVTPRVHLSWTPKPLTVLRFSIARGQRTASIFAENIGLWASSRQVVLHGQNARNPYGLDAEIAWNTGINLTQGFAIADRPATFTVGAYYTHYLNQIVVDYDQSPQELHFYNLTGRSYSHSLMAQWDVEVLPRLEARLAYRFNDVRTDYRQGRLERPLVSRHRAFLNLAYATRSDFHLDLTLNWQGAKRLPSTAANPEMYRAPAYSPDFMLVNAQVSKRWGSRYDLYIGAENLLGFRQLRPIIAADDPFGPYFDSTLVWGPIFGRNLYIGGRWRIQ